MRPMRVPALLSALLSALVLAQPVWAQEQRGGSARLGLLAARGHAPEREGVQPVARHDRPAPKRP